MLTEVGCIFCDSGRYSLKSSLLLIEPPLTITEASVRGEPLLPSSDIFERLQLVIDEPFSLVDVPS